MKKKFKSNVIRCAMYCRVGNIEQLGNNTESKQEPAFAKQVNNKKISILEENEFEQQEENKIYSIKVIYTSNQTFTKYFNFKQAISEDNIKQIRLDIMNRKYYIMDIPDRWNAEEVKSNKDLKENTRIIRIKEVEQM